MLGLRVARRSPRSSLSLTLQASSAPPPFAGVLFLRLNGFSVTEASEKTLIRVQDIYTTAISRELSAKAEAPPTRIREPSQYRGTLQHLRGHRPKSYPREIPLGGS